jgi:hypothetical protein
MSRPLILLALLSLLSPSRASELQLKTKFLPLYIQYAVLKEGEETVHAKPRSIRFESRGAEPETTLSFLNHPFTPAHDSTWNTKGDSNLISLCGIKVTHDLKQLPGGVFELQIILDLSNFKKPNEVSLSKAEVMKLVREAITLNFGETEIIIRNGE